MPEQFTAACGAVRDVLPCVLEADHHDAYHQDVYGYRWPTAAAEQATAEPEQAAAEPGRLVMLDGRDALAAVIIRPVDGDPDSISVEANARGMSKAAAAYALRQTADEFDRAAAAEGDELITPEEAAAEQAARPAVNYAGGSHLTTDGDTLATIAERYGHNLADLADANPWAASPRLTLCAGLRVRLPGGHGGQTVVTAEQQPRRILTEDEYETAYLAARHAIGHAAATRIGPAPLTDAITGALAAVGILAPPPEPDEDTCTAMWPDTDGIWQQCADDPHDDNGHDSGDWAWTDDAPNAIPARDDDAEGTA